MSQCNEKSLRVQLLGDDREISEIRDLSREWGCPLGLLELCVSAGILPALELPAQIMTMGGVGLGIRVETGQRLHPDTCWFVFRDDAKKLIQIWRKRAGVS